MTVPVSMQQLSTRTDIDVALSIEDEVSAAEGAIRTRRLVPHRDVRGYLCDRPAFLSSLALHHKQCHLRAAVVEGGSAPDPVQHGSL